MKPFPFITIMTLAVGALVSTPSGVKADLMLTQQGTSNTWNIDFDPILFTANANPGTLDWLVFEDFFSVPATANGNGAVTGSLSISVNGNPASVFNVNTSSGTFSTTVGGIDPNDLFVNIAQASSLSVADGDTVLVTPSNISFTSPSVPAPVAGPVDAGFYSNQNPSNRLVQTDFVSTAIVPEPASVALTALGGLALFVLRRKK